MLFAAVLDAPNPPKAPPLVLVVDEPKPVFPLVFVAKGLAPVDVLFVPPNAPPVLPPPPPKSELPAFVDPKPPVAGLFWPKSPAKVSEFLLISAGRQLA